MNLITRLKAVSYQIVSLVATRERVWVVDAAGALYVVELSSGEKKAAGF